MTDAPVTISMTKDELASLMREAVREELNHVGLVVDESDDVMAAREDFRFMRKLRVAFDKAGGVIGKTILTAIVMGILGLFVKAFGWPK